MYTVDENEIVGYELVNHEILRDSLHKNKFLKVFEITVTSPSNNDNSARRSDPEKSATSLIRVPIPRSMLQCSNQA